MKKFISVLLSIIISFGCFDLSVFAVTDEEEMMAIMEEKTLDGQNYNIAEILDEIGDSENWGCVEDDIQPVTDPVEEGVSELVPMEHIIGGVANPQWGVAKNTEYGTISNHKSGIHGYIIDQANQVASNTIPDKYTDLVYSMCKNCDNIYGVGKDNECFALHGNDNYIATVFYLWKLARIIEKKYDEINPSNTSDENRIIATSASELYDELFDHKISANGETLPPCFRPAVKERTFKNKNNVNEKIFENLRDRTISILLNNYRYKKGCLGYTTESQTDKKRCKYILYGMIMHRIGDAYAHCVTLKPNAMDKINHENGVPHTYTEADRAIYLEPEFFTADLFDLGLTTSEIKYGHLYLKEDGSPVYVYNSPNEKIRIPINRLKQFLRVSDPQRETASHKRYADNPNFYPERLIDCILSTKYLLNNYSKVSTDSDAIAKEAWYCLMSTQGFTLFNDSCFKYECKLQNY